MINPDITFSVSTLNKYIKQMFDNNFSLRGLLVKGEVSNLKKYSSGHVYFTLKDAESSIKAVMFYDYAKNMPSSIKDGAEVIVGGRVSVYPARGEYQIYAESIVLFGAGDQLLELELLKKKLAKEGLFDESRKRKINIFPKAVGIISAPNSAALADIQTNLLRRYPLLEVKIFPSLVQGAEAPKELLEALNEAKNSQIDTLIIGRGGGASEDLSAFNDETLVREAAKFPVPIISAVGHEIDFTLIDYVADARASTPTGAAELATADKREIYQYLDSKSNKMDQIIYKRISDIKNKIKDIKMRSFFVSPKTMYEDKLVEVENIKNKLNMLFKHIIGLKSEEIKSRKAHLEALSPNGVLNRGYSIIQDNSGNVLNDINEVSIDQMVKTIMKNGTITSKVIEKEKSNGRN
jgi:exodeoxyribonuclease VII large subunit